MLSNCGAGEDSSESIDNKEIKPVNPKGNQPCIFTGSTDAKAEAPTLWSPFTTRRTDSSEKTLMLGKIEGRRRKGHQRMTWLQGITDAMSMNLGKLWEMTKDREAWRTAVHGVVKSLSRLGD